MHLLVTRPREDAEGLSSALLAAGHQVTIEPLLEVSLLAVSVAAVAEVDALVVTSRHGVRALAASPEALAGAVRLPVLAVGSSTAAALRAVGFTRVAAGSGEAVGLPATAAAELPPGARTLHLSGAEVAFDLAPLFRARGFDYRRRIVYRAEMARALSPGLQQLLKGRRLGGVLLMSPRTAEAWAALVEDVQLLEEARTLVHYCLSCRVAEALAQLAPGDIRVAAAPTMAALMALVDGVTGGR